MRGSWLLLAGAVLIAGSGWPSSAADFAIREQLGIVSATANGKTATDSLPPGASGTISASEGEPSSGSDFGKATATTEFQADAIFISLTADVNEFGNDGAAKGRVVVQFSVDANTRYELPIATTAVTGEGVVDDRAVINLSNDDGVIFNQGADGKLVCNQKHPDYQTLCEKQELTPGGYSLELRASAYAPANCDTCEGVAVNAKSEVKFTSVP